MAGAAAIPVYSYPVDRNSAYVPLLFTGIEDRYRPIYRQDGSPRDALDDLDAGRDVVVHVHWEEFVVRACASDADADAAVDDFARCIEAIRARGGALLWTVHNELPHTIPYRRHFLAMRALLATCADAILVHDAVAIDVLAAQVALDRSRVRVLAHPSYLDRFEDERTLRAGLARSHDRCVQGFGYIRRQKGFADMIGMLPAAYLASRRAFVRISGDGAEEAAAIAEETGRRDVVWDVRHVPDRDVPDLLRSAACVVLPYERVLTSGVALLAISVGAVLVAVDIPQLRALLPPENARFLYGRGDGRALRGAIDDVLALSAGDRRAVVAANLAVARDRHPAVVAMRLAGIYDEVRASRSKRAGRARTNG